MAKYIVLCVIIVIATIVYGLILFWLDKCVFVNRLARKILTHSKWTYEEIRASLIGVVYYLFPLMILVPMFIIFRFDIFCYLLIKPSYLFYILLTILAEFSAVTLTSGLLTMFSEKTDWTNEIRNIVWIQSIKKRNPSVAPFVPLLGSLAEEFFFRGFIFLFMYTQFPQFGFVFPMLWSSILFALQQILFTKNSKQGLSMILGSVMINLIGCIAIVYTGSMLPGIIAHACFVFFYIGRMKVFAS